MGTIEENLKGIASSFLTQVVTAIEYLRYSCKSYLTMKRSENKESDRENSKRLSKCLSDMRKKITEELEFSPSTDFFGTRNLDKIQLRDKNNKQKKMMEIETEIKNCEKFVKGLFFGEKKINDYKKYFDRRDFKKFKVVIENLKKFIQQWDRVLQYLAYGVSDI